MNLWHDIAPARVRPEDFFAVIEIEKGSKNKYEMDKETGALRLDRILYTSTHYPANYGFIPRTWADDGDPLDVLVLCSECIRPLSLVECYPIGVISMEDSGSLDEKIIAIPFQDPTYNTYQDISELPNHVASEIRHFFRVYKGLEGKETVVSDVLGREEAIKIIIKCQNAYIEKYCRYSKKRERLTAFPFLFWHKERRILSNASFFMPHLRFTKYSPSNLISNLKATR